MAHASQANNAGSIPVIRSTEAQSRSLSDRTCNAAQRDMSGFVSLSPSLTEAKASTSVSRRARRRCSVAVVTRLVVGAVPSHQQLLALSLTTELN